MEESNICRCISCGSNVFVQLSIFSLKRTKSEILKPPVYLRSSGNPRKRSLSADSKGGIAKSGTERKKECPIREESVFLERGQDNIVLTKGFMDSSAKRFTKPRASMFSSILVSVEGIVDGANGGMWKNSLTFSKCTMRGECSLRKCLFKSSFSINERICSSTKEV